MRKSQLVVLFCVSLAAGASASPLYPPDPSGTPVRGPIRPKTLTIRPSPSNELLQSSLHLARTNYRTNVIFWGQEWKDHRFAADKIAGIDRFYEGYSNSNYANAIDEYFDGRTSSVAASIEYRGHIVDSATRLHSRSEFADSVAVEREICRHVRAQAVDIKPFKNYIAVYASSKPRIGNACGIRGVASCDIHGESPFAYSLIYDLDGNSECDPRDRETGHSQGLAALANASARALNKVQTNFAFVGYQDLSRNEVDDKCAWTFNVPYVTFTNGSIWKLQGLWSNAAYDSDGGYANWRGQKGCVDGR